MYVNVYYSIASVGIHAHIFYHMNTNIMETFVDLVFNLLTL